VREGLRRPITPPALSGRVGLRHRAERARMRPIVPRGKPLERDALVTRYFSLSLDI
jgi:hypothetical protein